MTRAQAPDVADLRELWHAVQVRFRHEPERQARLLAHVDRAIADAWRWSIDVAPLPGGAWRLGPSGEAQIYQAAPSVLEAAHGAICGYEVRAADFAKPGAKRAGNSVRTRLRAAAEWAERVVCCPILTDVLRHVRVIGGRVVYQPAPGAPRIITE